MFLSLLLRADSTGCSGQFHVVFKHFENLENLILNILKEKLQLATISKAMFKFWSIFHIQNLWDSFTKDNSFLQILSQSLPA